MKSFRHLGTILAAVTLMITPLVSAESHGSASAPAATFDDALAEARESTEARLHLRIEIEGQLDDGARRVVLFGRGIGIWDGKRQFGLTNDAVSQAIDLLLESGFSAMPERFVPREPDDRQNPVQLIRMITVHVGDYMKMVIQDNKGAKSVEFQRLVDRLVALCKEPASHGITASSLEDGLRKIAEGTLAGETLWINANAPEMRSLDSQRGQGWLVSVRAGLLTVQTHDIENGYQKNVERQLGANEGQLIARSLVAANVHKLPANVSAPGYTQLTVAVLDHNLRTLARANPGSTGEAGEAATKDFKAVRRILQNLYRGNLNFTEDGADRSSAKASKRPTDG
jgi:hypothetical protein